MQQVALDGIDHRGQVFGNAGRFEGGKGDKIFSFYQPFDLQQITAQIGHRANQRFCAGSHRHSPDTLRIPPEGQDMTCFMEGCATRASVHDPASVVQVLSTPSAVRPGFVQKIFTISREECGYRRSPLLRVKSSADSSGHYGWSAPAPWQKCVADRRRIQPGKVPRPLPRRPPTCACASLVPYR
ncbi:hypothetical protein D3C77_449040 [compost metagenome]